MSIHRSTRAAAGLLLAAATLAAAAASAHAQEFPSKPIRLIIPSSAGASTDVIGRTLGRVVEKQTGQSVIVENRPGASGSIGVSAVVRSAPDGYTILLSVPDAVVIYPIVRRKPLYNAEKELMPLTLVNTAHMAFAVPASSPVNTMKELVAAAAARPGKMTFSTAGLGTLSQMCFELLKHRTGIDIVHVPYSGAGPALVGMIGGQNDMTVTTAATLRPQLDSGKVKVLAIAKETRAASLPNVPTMAEAGFPDFLIPTWFAVFVPAGVPEPIAQRLDSILRAAMATPDFAKASATFGLDVGTMSRADFARFVTVESARFRQIAERSKILVDD